MEKVRVGSVKRLLWEEKIGLRGCGAGSECEQSRTSKKIKIGVTGIGRGSGATFVAMSLALSLSEKVEGVSFVEKFFLPEGETCIYRQLAMDRHFKSRKFFDVFAAASRGESILNKINFYKKINWVVHGLNSASSEINLQQVAGKFLIVDTPRNKDDMDVIVAVIDPLPSRIYSGLEDFADLRENYSDKVVWLLNKDNDGVNHKEMERFLMLKPQFRLKLLPAQYFYQSEYNCTLPELDKLSQDVFDILSDEILKRLALNV